MISSFSSIGLIKKPQIIIPSGPTASSVVVIGTGNYSYAYSSNYTFATSTFGNIGATYSAFVPTAVCCGNVNSAPLWVAIGTNGTTKYSAVSTTGTSWTLSNNISAIFNSSGWCYSVSYGNNIFMATGYSGTSGSSQVAISSDGLTWKTGGFPFTTTSFGNSSYYGNGYWVVVGNSGLATNSTMYSTNVSIAGNSSITWTTVGTTNNPAYSIIFNGSFWVIGTNNYFLYRSANTFPNSGYTSIPSGYPQFVGPLGYNGNNIVFGGSSSSITIYNIPNINNTTIIGNATISNLLRPWQFDYNTTNSVFVLAGDTGVNTNSFSYSTNNGVSWTNNTVVSTKIYKCVGVAFAR